MTITTPRRAAIPPDSNAHAPGARLCPTPIRLAPAGDIDPREPICPPSTRSAAAPASNRQRAVHFPTPEPEAPAGATTPRRAKACATPVHRSPGGATNSRQAAGASTTLVEPPAGGDSRPAMVLATPIRAPSGGTQTPHPAVQHPVSEGQAPGGVQHAGRLLPSAAQTDCAASDQTADRHRAADTRYRTAVGCDAGRDPTAIDGTPTNLVPLSDPALAMAADVLDDIERVRIANENRHRQLTRSVEDSDGETRGFGYDESHPDVARLAGMVDMLLKVEHDATLNLQRVLRRHPLHGWMKAQRGIGEKQGARLLAAIGDPYIRPEIVRDDGTVVPSGPRTVSALWAYCGLHVLPASGQQAADNQGDAAAGWDQLSADRTASDNQRFRVGGVGGDPGHNVVDTHQGDAGVAPKRARGQKANWSTKAKTKAYLIATSCLKQLVKPCHNPDEGPTVHVEDCACSPYRRKYDSRRAHTAVTHPEWTDGHSHNDALRVAAKEVLKHLWRAAKAHHEGADTQ